ncbi:MAG: hypothetical protein R8K20_11870 [Gallionellaceae bacterium]
MKMQYNNKTGHTQPASQALKLGWQGDLYVFDTDAETHLVQITSIIVRPIAESAADLFEKPFSNFFSSRNFGAGLILNIYR